MKNFLFSIVVTTKNEEKNIQNCLESIKNQSYQKLEIIIVDNFSTDKTVEISKKYTNKVFLLGPERSAQRNYGMIKQSIGDFVVYIDADMILSKRLLENCNIFLNNYPEVSGIFVSEIILGKNYWSKVRNFERSFYNGTVIDACRVYKKDDFIKSGGFDEKIFVTGSGEDWDLDKSIKKIGKLALLNEIDKKIEKDDEWVLGNFIKNNYENYNSRNVCIYHNENNFKILKYLEKKFQYTSAFDRYIKKWGNDEDIKKQLGWRYRFFIVFFEHGKWKKLIQKPSYAFGMYALRFMVGMTFIFRKLIDGK